MLSQKIKKENNIYTVSRTYNKVIEMDLAFHHAKTLCNKKQKAQKFYHPLQENVFLVTKQFVIKSPVFRH